MLKDASYHESAIIYNEELAAAADAVADKLTDPEVQRWSRSVAKQHRFHLGRHKKALKKFQHQEDDTMTQDAPASKPDENGLTAEDVARLDSATDTASDQEGLVVTTYDGQTIDDFEKAQEDDRDAGTGKFVTEEYAEDHPDTTVHESRPMAAQPVDAAPDATQAAAPVEATPMTVEEAQRKFAEAQAEAEAAAKSKGESE